MPTVLESMNAALHAVFAKDDRVVILGEDILDPYGGAFKVTQGLSTKFPDRVLTTPVSEAGITGIAAGMAMRGLRPVVEIMFGDFVTLIADQLINHIAKFRFMYNDQVRVPLVIRTPMGGRRGYGPTHSQTLEKLFLGVPGLRVLAPNALDDPGRLLQHAILDDDDPVLFVENKLLYGVPVVDGDKSVDLTARKLPLTPAKPGGGLENVLPQVGYAQTILLNLRGAPSPQITLAAYGYMAELGRKAIHHLAYESEIFVEMVVPAQLSPFEMDPILHSAGNTGRLLVVEEGTHSLGWGSEIVARVAEKLGGNQIRARRLAAKDFPIPASIGLEEAILPGVADIIQAVKSMV